MIVYVKSCDAAVLNDINVGSLSLGISQLCIQMDSPVSAQSQS